MSVGENGILVLGRTTTGIIVQPGQVVNDGQHFPRFYGPPEVHEVESPDVPFEEAVDISALSKELTEVYLGRGWIDAFETAGTNPGLDALKDIDRKNREYEFYYNYTFSILSGNDEATAYSNASMMASDGNPRINVDTGGSFERFYAPDESTFDQFWKGILDPTRWAGGIMVKVGSGETKVDTTYLERWIGSSDRAGELTVTTKYKPQPIKEGIRWSNEWQTYRYWSEKSGWGSKVTPKEVLNAARNNR